MDISGSMCTLSHTPFALLHRSSSLFISWFHPQKYFLIQPLYLFQLEFLYFYIRSLFYETIQMQNKLWVSEHSIIYQ